MGGTRHDVDGRVAQKAAHRGAACAGDGSCDGRLDSAIRPLRRAGTGGHLRAAGRSGLDGRKPSVRAPLGRRAQTHRAGVVRGGADGRRRAFARLVERRHATGEADDGRHCAPRARSVLEQLHRPAAVPQVRTGFDRTADAPPP